MKKSLLFGIILAVCVVIVAFVFAQVYPVGMISIWKFDEGEGTMAFDSVDANHGNIYGATWTTGQVNGALSFDGRNDRVIIYHSDSLNITEAVTVAAWVKPNGCTGNYEYLVEKGTWAGNGAWFFFFHREPDHHANFGIGIPGGIYFKNCGMIGGLADGAWSQIVGTYDRQNIKLYVNGVLNRQVAWTEPIRQNSHHVYIGAEGARYYYKGKIDEVAVYNRALTGCEIYQHYNNVLGYTLEDTIETLILHVEGLELPKGIEKSLTSQLDNALDSLERGRDNAAKKQLQAFIYYVEALRGKKLTDDQADALIIAAQCIIDNI